MKFTINENISSSQDNNYDIDDAIDNSISDNSDCSFGIDNSFIGTEFDTTCKLDVNSKIFQTNYNI